MWVCYERCKEALDIDEQQAFMKGTFSTWRYSKALCVEARLYPPKEADLPKLAR